MVDKENKNESPENVKSLKIKKYKFKIKKILLQKLNEKKELTKKLENELQEMKKLAQEKDNLSKEYLEYLKRLQADFENYKKQQEKKKKEFIEFANEKLLNNLLPVVDNLEKALDSTKNENNLETIKQGINNILKDFHNILMREGVHPIKALDQKFDPYKHEAVMSFETDKYPEDTVTEELRKGYYIKSKVLRPAMVKVAILTKQKKNTEKEN
ncbi:MAG: nucleotide exchange factor GrpE [Candidatus Infernicultor aquiphilus]|uniref:Protein GrpE n=2 Tax=Candidatus Infernicultor aquiphilus TaxID=1805029 RepID=A0A2M8CFB0_9BACT|nr:MAG: nucleotide exchange factor GrpE [Candidatus Atribacteria bacterium CG_4_8_14_3_um_filter_34_18]PJB57765.1 MAG: nucleotide exchange factor GrpE [Candidatus Atribacteria bacterium CG_4_9_14_3_um_filter_33_16]